MISLQKDCLFFQVENGDVIPCSAEDVVMELLNGDTPAINSEIVHNVTMAIIHYFKHELGRINVSVDEFIGILETVLTDLGYTVETVQVEDASESVITETDLERLAQESGNTFEIAFFQILKAEILRKLKCSPDLLRIKGLRACVKQLTGAKRWCPRCRALNEQIVTFLRKCYQKTAAAQNCIMEVR
ncbi:MAG: hypothetical protein K9N52_04775 [Verrucomicrobia bacterium]|nr:hypothetical protein [Verrucomicrobiota bacterium]